MCDVALLADDVVQFRIDTGMTGASNIEHDLFVKLQAGGMLTDDSRSIFNRRVSVTIHGLTVERAAVLKQLRIGEQVYESVRVRDSTENILGLDFLSRYLTTLDFPNDRLFLEQRKQEPRGEDQSNCSCGATAIAKDAK